MVVTTQAPRTVPVIGSFIGGEFVKSGDPNLTTYNPASPTEQVAQAIPCSAEDIDRAVGSAARAQERWRNLSGPARADYLYKWADQIQLVSAQMSSAVASEVGKPIGEAKGEVSRCIAILRYYAGEAVRQSGEVIPGLASSSLQYSIRTPLGVVGLITPWNFPVAIPLWKAAPALASGNTVVLKPSELSLLCATMLAESASAAGLPEGVFNVLLGDGQKVGEHILSHSLIRGVSFTGSARVGSIVATQCAKRNIKFQTEMGGKNPAIVLPDADLKLAATLVAGGAMRFAGQKCTATSRVIVHRDVVDEFVELLVPAIEGLKVSDPMESDCAVGPVISEVSKSRIEAALADAGKPLYQGSTPSKGFFVPPTVYADVDPTSPLGQVELFGPVLAMFTATDLDHAITLANEVEFGLSASIFTRDVASAFRYASRIEAGMVRVNADTTGVDPHAPFGGVKGSSSGSREQGPAAKDFYTEVKTIQINP